MSAVPASRLDSAIQTRSPTGEAIDPASEQAERSSLSRVDDEFWVDRKRVNANRRQASLALAIPLVAVFGIVDGYIAPQARTELWLIRFGVFMPIVVAVFMATVRQPMHPSSEMRIVLGLVGAGICLTAMTLIAPEHFTGILLLTFASYTFLGLRFVHACSAAVAVTLIYAVAVVADGGTRWVALATNIFFLAGCNALGAFVCYMLEQGARHDFSHGRALSEQRRRSEHLLLNMLPVRMVQRLKSHRGAIAETHPDVTILFADIVDFTAYAALVAPARLVQLLDEVFTRFDALAQRHGLEKIKTIGDAYMAAGGLRTQGADQVRAVADLALEMLASVRGLETRVGRKLSLRIGIHTGPVVAGIIGRAKFAYDVWGDTVNIASRLESLATPGTIQLSQATRDRLCDDYEFSQRRLVKIDGRREIGCYVLLSRRPAPGDRRPLSIATRTLRVAKPAAASTCLTSQCK